MLAQEHLIYPQALRWFVDGRLTLTENGRVLLDGELPAAVALVAPLAR